MKYIEKNLKHEPKTLKDYRETTPNATYKGFVDSDHLLKKALLKEQGWICAYCMNRISLKRNERLKKPSIEVEHFLSQDEHPEMDLIYDNMLGVCNGNKYGVEHCDKSKKEILLKKLNPKDRQVESFLTYNKDGTIKSKLGDLETEQDLELLKLNNQSLKELRKQAIFTAFEIMKDKNPPPKQWTKALIQKEIDLWNSKNKNGKFRPFCKVVTWFWEQQKKRNRYPKK